MSYPPWHSTLRSSSPSSSECTCIGPIICRDHGNRLLPHSAKGAGQRTIALLLRFIIVICFKVDDVIDADIALSLLQKRGTQYGSDVKNT